MADEEQLTILRKGAKEWNEWRQRHENIPICLDGANLSQTDLSCADLSEAHLNQANLRGVNLLQAKLRNADLSDTDLRDANLSNADLRNADFNDAIVRNANFFGALLSDADLSGADLREANLAKSELDRTILNHSDLNGANLNTANLCLSFLVKANLVEADLGNTELNYTYFSEADLRGANLEGTVLHGTTFVNTNLSEAKNLDKGLHHGPCTVDHQTLRISGPLPLSFLRGVGFSDTFIEYIPSLFGQGIQFYSAFISHSHEDKPFARRLYDVLQGRGIRCWFDEKNLTPGQDLYGGIDHGIRVWDKVLLICSEATLTSWWVNKEIEKTLEKERRLSQDRGEDVRSLVPLDLDGYIRSNKVEHRWATDIQSRVAADFSGWESDNDKFERQLERVIEALKTPEGRPPDPEPKL